MQHKQSVRERQLRSALMQESERESFQRLALEKAYRLGVKDALGSDPKAQKALYDDAEQRLALLDDILGIARLQGTTGAI
jgi:hypothetical protein